MTTYEEFVKPHLKPRDGFQHAVILQYITAFGKAINAAYLKNFVDETNTNYLDDVMMQMQLNGYEIISLSTTQLDDRRYNVIIHYK